MNTFQALLIACLGVYEVAPAMFLPAPTEAIRGTTSLAVVCLAACIVINVFIRSFKEASK